MGTPRGFGDSSSKGGNLGSLPAGGFPLSHHPSDGFSKAYHSGLKTGGLGLPWVVKNSPSNAKSSHASRLKDKQQQNFQKQPPPPQKRSKIVTNSIKS